MNFKEAIKNVSEVSNKFNSTGGMISGNVTVSGNVNAIKFSGPLIGNASTATSLLNSININGTSFNGTSSITTDSWGAARNITIGSSTKPYNGSTNIAWSLSEIGASPSSHDHNSDYVALSSNGSTTIRADADASSTSEYISLKAGHNELKVISSAGGGTVTQGSNKLTFNGNQVFHSGVSEMNLTNVGTVGQSTKQITSISPASIGFTDYVEGNAKSSTIGNHNGWLEFYSSSMYFYPTSSNGVNFNGNVTISPALKNGCVFTSSGMDSIMHGAFNMGQSMLLGSIACMSVAQMSDRTTKEEIKYLDNNEDDKLSIDDCYNFFLNEFKPVSFKYKKRVVDSPELGFIAQDVDETKLSDYILIKKPNQPIGFNNYSFTSALAIAFQKAVKELNELKIEVEKLKNK